MQVFACCVLELMLANERLKSLLFQWRSCMRSSIETNTLEIDKASERERDR